MPNPYFQFKQFYVYHNQCAMKVGSDGVLLGAWANTNKANHILDIGSGSGLIALMLAQRSHALLHAIDIDKNATLQTQFNFEHSPWKDRMKVWQADVKNLDTLSKQRYDLIVSNPPFFNNSLKNPDAFRTLARHTDTLLHTQLIDSALRLFAPEARLSVILPVAEALAGIDYAQAKGLHLERKTWVLPKPQAPAKRLLLEFSTQCCTTLETEITIETKERNVFTSEYKALLKDYFLKF